MTRCKALPDVIAHGAKLTYSYDRRKAAALELEKYLPFLLLICTPYTSYSAADIQTCALLRHSPHISNHRTAMWHVQLAHLAAAYAEWRAHWSGGDGHSAGAGRGSVFGDHHTACFGVLSGSREQGAVSCL
jgi:hypothetical protein